MTGILNVLCLTSNQSSCLKEKNVAEYLIEYRINNQGAEMFMSKNQRNHLSNISDSINISLSKFVFIYGKHSFLQNHRLTDFLTLETNARELSRKIKELQYFWSISLIHSLLILVFCLRQKPAEARREPTIFKDHTTMNIYNMQVFSVFMH